MSKHTPGPWMVLREAGGWITTVGEPYGHGQMHIADVRGWGHLTGRGACALDHAAAVEIQDANADLIAAAPELLAALKDLREVVHHDCGEDEGVHLLEHIAPASLRAADAIAKAEGRR